MARSLTGACSRSPSLARRASALRAVTTASEAVATVEAATAAAGTKPATQKALAMSRGLLLSYEKSGPPTEGRSHPRTHSPKIGGHDNRPDPLCSQSWLPLFICLPRMPFAVGRILLPLFPAKMKATLCRVADRPPAHAIVKRKESHELATVSSLRLYLFFIRFYPLRQFGADSQDSRQILPRATMGLSLPIDFGEGPFDPCVFKVTFEAFTGARYHTWSYPQSELVRKYLCYLTSPVFAPHEIEKPLMYLLFGERAPLYSREVLIPQAIELATVHHRFPPLVSGCICNK